MNISIIGYGNSGKALQNIFPAAVIYDPALPEYSHTQSTAFQADVSFVCIPTLPLSGGAIDISNLESIVSESKVNLIVICSVVRPKTSCSLAEKHKKRIVFLSEHSNLKILGGSNEDTSNIQNLFTKHSDEQIQYIRTTLETAELCRYVQQIGHAMQVTFVNEFIELANILEANYCDLSKTFDGIFSQKLNYNSMKQKRGIQNDFVQNTLLSAINIAHENDVLSFFLEGISRANNFNLRKNTPYQTGAPSRILFYQIEQPYGYFSNFSNHPVYLKNKIWMTTEHYYQAQKFINTSYEEEVRLASSPVRACQMGLEMASLRQKNWTNVKNSVMREAIYAKFTQHPDLRSNLIYTGNAELVEHTSNDSYWGDGGDGSGKNMLGKILMEVRSNLQKEESHDIK